MSKEKLGVKRKCSACDAKFYDLSKTPIICPKCGHRFDSALMAAKKPVKEVAPVASIEGVKGVKDDEEDEIEDQAVEISLDDLVEGEENGAGDDGDDSKADENGDTALENFDGVNFPDDDDADDDDDDDVALIDEDDE